MLNFVRKRLKKIRRYLLGSAKKPLRSSSAIGSGLTPSFRPRLADQVKLLNGHANVILDLGAHEGQTAGDYAEAFPDARIFSFEPERVNFKRAVYKLSKYGGRIRVILKAVSDQVGNISFNVNSHSGTHSILPIGDTQFWAEPAETTEIRTVESTSIDVFSTRHGISDIDILKMDIQGGELAALQGARELLSQGRIKLISTEVEFQALYEGRPLFWEVAAFLKSFGFGFYGLYDSQFHRENSSILCWADAIFVGPALTAARQNHDRS